MADALIKWNDDEPGKEWRMPDLAERKEQIRRAVFPPSIEFDTAEYWEWMRGLSRTEAWRVSGLMTSMLFREVQAEIEAEHPNWNVWDVKVEFCARMYGPTLAGHLRHDLKRRELAKRENNGDSD